MASAAVNGLRKPSYSQERRSVAEITRNLVVVWTLESVQIETYETRKFVHKGCLHNTNTACTFKGLHSWKVDVA